MLHRRGYLDLTLQEGSNPHPCVTTITINRTTITLPVQLKTGSSQGRKLSLCRLLHKLENWEYSLNETM